MCDFKNIEQLFHIGLTSKIIKKDGTFAETPKSDTSLTLSTQSTQSNTITQLYDTYQAPTQIDYKEDDGITRKTDKTIELDLSTTSYLHITVNNVNHQSIDIETNITLSGRNYRLMGVILYRSVYKESPLGGHYRYIRINGQPSINLSNTPSILYNDMKVTYYEKLPDDMIKTIKKECRELLYVFTGNAPNFKGGRTKRVIRRHTYVHDM